MSKETTKFLQAHHVGETAVETSSIEIFPSGQKDVTYITLTSSNINTYLGQNLLARQGTTGLFIEQVITVDHVGYQIKPITNSTGGYIDFHYDQAYDTQQSDFSARLIGLRRYYNGSCYVSFKNASGVEQLASGLYTIVGTRSSDVYKNVYARTATSGSTTYNFYIKAVLISGSSYKYQFYYTSNGSTTVYGETTNYITNTQEPWDDASWSLPSFAGYTLSIRRHATPIDTVECHPNLIIGTETDRTALVKSSLLNGTSGVYAKNGVFTNGVIGPIRGTEGSRFDASVNMTDHSINNVFSLGARSIELSTSNNGGFIDFHYNQSTDDYTARIIESTQGTITISNNVTVPGTLTVNTSATVKNLSAGSTRITNVATPTATTDAATKDYVDKKSVLGTANAVVVTDANKNIVASSNITTTELGYLDGVTGNVQTQLNGILSSRNSLLNTSSISGVSGAATGDKLWEYFTAKNGTTFVPSEEIDGRPTVIKQFYYHDATGMYSSYTSSDYYNIFHYNNAGQNQLLVLAAFRMLVSPAVRFVLIQGHVPKGPTDTTKITNSWVTLNYCARSPELTPYTIGSTYTASHNAYWYTGQVMIPSVFMFRIVCVSDDNKIIQGLVRYVESENTTTLNRPDLVIPNTWLTANGANREAFKPTFTFTVIK